MPFLLHVGWGTACLTSCPTHPYCSDTYANPYHQVPNLYMWAAKTNEWMFGYYFRFPQKFWFVWSRNNHATKAYQVHYRYCASTISSLSIDELRPLLIHSSDSKQSSLRQLHSWKVQTYRAGRVWEGRSPYHRLTQQIKGIVHNNCSQHSYAWLCMAIHGYAWLCYSWLCRLIMSMHCYSWLSQVFSQAKVLHKLILLFNINTSMPGVSFNLVHITFQIIWLHRSFHTILPFTSNT